MARGKRIASGQKLVPFNTKTLQETKDLADALVDIHINGTAGLRELIEDMLRVYEEKHPQEFAQARTLIKLKNEREVIINGKEA